MLPACGRRVRFYLSHGLKGVCEINRFQHWCSVGTGKSQPKGPSFQLETRLVEFPTDGGAEGWDFSGTTEQ